MMNEAVDRAAWYQASRHGESSGGDTSGLGRILIVDDDFEMRHMILNYLTAQNLRAVPVQGRQEMARQFAAGEPSLVVLDLCLGDDDGLDLLRDIRSRSDVPVIITTGHRRDEIDVVLGLELGADDYLAKPFGLRELLARIRAVLRRREAKPVAGEREAERGRYQFGGWELDRRMRRLTNPHGGPVMLTKGEYALLTAFVDAPQRPLTASTSCEQAACTRMSSTVASTYKSCACVGSSRLIQAHRKSSAPSVVSATCLLCP